MAVDSAGNASGRQAHPAATQPFGDPLDNRAHFIRQPRGSRPSSGPAQAQARLRAHVAPRSTTRVASTPWLIICKSAKSGLMDEPTVVAKGGEGRVWLARNGLRRFSSVFFVCGRNVARPSRPTRPTDSTLCCLPSPASTRH